MRIWKVSSSFGPAGWRASRLHEDGGVAHLLQKGAGLRVFLLDARVQLLDLREEPATGPETQRERERERGRERGREGERVSEVGWLVR